ncbi:MAG: ribbon-helix-helix domain-containing protein [Alphaproteobacteria bacterium]|nr:ribbon-helix-helix domain-containing protein [Alphaproteobacteria bacterium]
MIKISVLIAGRHSTSISLEEEFFEELLNIAAEKKLSRNQLITLIDKTRTAENLSAAVRIYILQYYKEKALGKAD